MDNPDQRIAVDARAFTDTALTFSLTMFNALIDLISFSGGAAGVPLFAAAGLSCLPAALSCLPAALDCPPVLAQ